MALRRLMPVKKICEVLFLLGCGVLVYFMVRYGGLNRLTRTISSYNNKVEAVQAGGVFDMTVKSGGGNQGGGGEMKNQENGENNNMLLKEKKEREEEEARKKKEEEERNKQEELMKKEEGIKRQEGGNDEVKKRQEEERRRVEVEQEQEEERKRGEMDLKKKEDERKRQEEERRKIEERKRQEEEEMKMEAERVRKVEEAKKKSEEEIRRQKEEKKKREEESKRREEEERERREEEERKRKQEMQDQKKREQERRRVEEEKELIKKMEQLINPTQQALDPDFEKVTLGLNKSDPLHIYLQERWSKIDLIFNNLANNLQRNSMQDLQRFQQLMDVWPPNKPKGVIYFISGPDRFVPFMQIIAQLELYFNKVYKYPVVIFHELDWTVGMMAMVKAMFGHHNVYFQLINLANLAPKSAQYPENLLQCHSPLKNRHISWFNSQIVFNQPIMKGIEYYWHLDDSSQITGNISYDIFQRLKQSDADFGYHATESATCIDHLRSNVTTFCSNAGLDPTGLAQWPEQAKFQRGFELGRIDLWLSDVYKNYMHFIEKAGGIYYNSWDESDIHTYAVLLLVDESKRIQFSDVPYAKYAH